MDLFGWCRVNEYLVLALHVVLLPLVPVVRVRARKECSGWVEAAGRDWQALMWLYVLKVLQPFPPVLVPEHKLAVRTARGKSTVNWVERNVVDGVDHRFLRVTVALERKVFRWIFV